MAGVRSKSFVSPSDLPASPLHEDDPLSRPGGSWIGPPRRRTPQPGEVGHDRQELALREEPDDDESDDVVPGHAVKTGGQLDGKPIFQKPIATPKRLRRAAGTLDGVPIFYKPVPRATRKPARLL